MELPRLLEENRVEVRLTEGCTHVLTRPDIDGLLLHLNEAKNLLVKPTKAASSCGCNPEQGIVCQTCAVMAEKNVEYMGEYLNDFINKRFPSGLEGDIRRIISECVLDAFHDGARWSEQTRADEQMIIGVDMAAPGQDRSIIISPR